MHDTDKPRCKSKRINKEKSNGDNVVYDVFEMNSPAWTNNVKIQDQMTGESRVFASIINFEEAYFSETVGSNKPESCINHMKSDAATYHLIKNLLDLVIGSSMVSPPEGVIQWSQIGQLEQAVSKYLSSVTILDEGQ